MKDWLKESTIIDVIEDKMCCSKYDFISRTGIKLWKFRMEW
ncbi:MAG: hypothetical protein ACRCX8_08715 [Sarcina sp.]